MEEHYKSKVNEETIIEEIRRVNESRKDLEGRINVIENKIIEVKAYISELRNENNILEAKLKEYEHKNVDMETNID